ncbi:TetR family transcriptional regulator [Chelatococcus reniformis]|uniref:TetR family transcriptional regulator n=2 Tax=Chelatococcus reniformis TaxID=1494448 RepID=A0A916UTN1_9HYPH|nr:TetR family transcriptional regulator [Chelatococcus reniformis]
MFIIERTAALFATRGYAATSIGDIAEACECSKSRLYHYFDSKESILEQMMTTHVDKLLVECKQIVRRKKEPEVRFRELIRHFLEIYAVSRDKHVVLLTCMEFLPPEARDTVLDKERKLVAYVHDELARIRPDLAREPGLTQVDTMLFFGMINWTYTWFVANGAISPKEIADRSVDIFLQGYSHFDGALSAPPRVAVKA